MLPVVLLAVAIVKCSGIPIINPDEFYGVPYYKKVDWGGRPATSVTELVSPVPYVVIHHSYIPGACFDPEACKKAMRSMQDYHQLTNGWADIGYNFAVGSDGAIYEGRGWRAVGAHAVPYNSKSIGIVFIGDWRVDKPTTAQLDSAKRIIHAGVIFRFISDGYGLVGHRQISATECPGDALQEEISGWDHFISGQLPV